MKHLLFLIVCLVSCIICNAQVSISSSMLVGTKWLYVNQVSENKAFKFHYAFTKRNMTSQQEGRPRVHSYTYYLTDKIPQSYDKSKVGKPSKGCYLVEYSEKREDMTYYTIKSFNRKTGKMELYWEYDGKTIGGSTCTLELTRIKK